MSDLVLVREHFALGDILEPGALGVVRPQLIEQGEEGSMGAESGDCQRCAECEGTHRASASCSPATSL